VPFKVIAAPWSARTYAFDSGIRDCTRCGVGMGYLIGSRDCGPVLLVVVQSLSACLVAISWNMHADGEVTWYYPERSELNVEMAGHRRLA
jgi:hypothetical protein